MVGDLFCIVYLKRLQKSYCEYNLVIMIYSMKSEPAFVIHD